MESEEQDERRERGEPGGGRGRRDDVGRTGIWPASGPRPSGDAPLVAPGALGQAPAAAGSREAGGPPAGASDRDPVCGASVDPGQTGERAVYRDRTYYFDCPECRETFEQGPERFQTSLRAR